ncbi:MAG TPA: M48 family metalloprotease [Vicinamibacterales bacterium]|nr:M48 family metalloprotease [Vicinamibacterales bacterium]
MTAVCSLCLLAALASAGCATNPATGRRQFSLMSEAQEIQIGRQNDAEVRKEMGVYDDPALQAYVEQIGLRLARVSDRPNLPWHFTVLDVPAVNAFALPGGYIYVTRGILAHLDSEAQLAGVLGHEIGHVTARHGAQRYTRSAGAQLGLVLGSIFVPQTRPFTELAQSGLGLLFLKYSRGDELQADQLGATYEARAGWDPQGVPALLATLGRIQEATDSRGVPNWLQTHPQPVDRVQQIAATVARIERANPGRQWTTDRPEYLRRIDGIVYGDNPREGVVRASEFLHPELQFALRFPQGWPISNGREQVVAKQPGADVYMFLQGVDHPAGVSMAEVAATTMRHAGFTRVTGGETTIGGLPAYVGTYDGSLQSVGRVRLRAADIRSGSRTYLVAGFAPPAAFGGLADLFDRSIRSFRALTAEEASRIRPNRVRLHRVAPGETWASIAAGAGGGLVTPAALAILNGHAVDDPPRPAQEIKIVVAG